MIRKNIVKPLIESMKPKRRPGRIPTVRPCPHCGVSMSKTALATHFPSCNQSGNTPIQPADFMHDAGGGYNADFTFPQT